MEPLLVKIEPELKVLIKQEKSEDTRSSSDLNNNLLKTIKQEVTQDPVGNNLLKNIKQEVTQDNVGRQSNDVTCNSTVIKSEIHGCGVKTEPHEGAREPYGISVCKDIETSSADSDDQMSNAESAASENSCVQSFRSGSSKIKSDLQCNFCDFVGKTERKVAYHKRDTHGMIDPILLEKRKGEKRQTPQNDGIGNERKPKKVKYSCNLCSKKSSSQKGIAEHKKAMHNVIYPKIRSFQQTQSAFERKPDTLKPTPSTPKQKKLSYFVCYICKYHFVSKTSLKKHKIKKHKKKTKEGTNSKLVCELCHNKFCSEKSLEKHQRRNHNIFITDFIPADKSETNLNLP